MTGHRGRSAEAKFAFEVIAADLEAFDPEYFSNLKWMLEHAGAKGMLAFHASGPRMVPSLLIIAAAPRTSPTSSSSTSVPKVMILARSRQESVFSSCSILVGAIWNPNQSQISREPTSYQPIDLPKTPMAAFQEDDHDHNMSQRCLSCKDRSFSEVRVWLRSTLVSSTDDLMNHSRLGLTSNSTAAASGQTPSLRDPEGYQYIRDYQNS